MPSEYNNFMKLYVCQFFTHQQDAKASPSMYIRLHYLTVDLIKFTTGIGHAIRSIENRI